MKIQNVKDAAFSKHGKIVTNVDFAPLVDALNASTPLPEDVAYEPSVEVLEATSVFDELKTKTYGEMPIQIGYCNGHNSSMSLAEYHRDSEINVAATDAILIIGAQQELIEDGTKVDADKLEAFFVPAGTAVEVYATTLHYAPCGVDGNGFKVGIVLPRFTNFELKSKHEGGEDSLITAVNKWLIPLNKEINLY